MVGLKNLLRSPSKVCKNYAIHKLANWFPPGRKKNWILRRMGAKIHPSVWISPDCVIDPIFPEFVEINECVFLGWGARIFTHMVSKEGKNFIITTGKVMIGKHAFIGGFSTIRPGVSVGAFATVGSDSLVLKDVEREQTVIGIPAKPYKKKKVKSVFDVEEYLRYFEE